MALPGQVVLVLQGGGALGAYQLGVYEALREAGIEPDWVIGTSIGAIGAAVIAGNRPEDRLPRLRELWQRFEQGDASALDTSKVFADFSALVWGIPGFFSPRLPAWGGWKANVGLDAASFYSTAPLRETLAELVVPQLLGREIRLTVGAVNVTSGAMRYFDSRDEPITLDEVMASGALPPGFPAIRVNGEAYWDGGLSANPPVRPLLYECAARDIVLVLLQPARRPTLPLTADGIWSRLTEMSFTAALHAELEGIALAKREAERSPWSLGRLERKLRRLKLHRICAPEATSTQSRLDTRSVFMQALYNAGRAQADAWLGQYESPAAPARAIAPVIAGAPPG